MNRIVYEDVVQSQFGEWDEQFQSSYFDKKWQEQAFRIIELNGRDIGAIWVVSHSNHLRLREIQILPEFQGQGIGTCLIGDLILRARREHLPIRLVVIESNRARVLYERLGFRVTGDASESHYQMEYSERG